MLRTAAIFAVLMVGAFALIPRHHHAVSSARVDYRGQLSVVRNRAPFHVLAPGGLPATWIPTHVTIAVPQPSSSTSTFDLGLFVDSTDVYVDLYQSDAPDPIVVKLGAHGSQGETATIAGVPWQSWTDSSGHPALVRALNDGSTVVLSGVGGRSALTAQLAVLAGALR